MRTLEGVANVLLPTHATHVLPPRGDFCMRTLEGVASVLLPTHATHVLPPRGDFCMRIGLGKGGVSAENID
jgi:hypothetical protein